MAFRPGPAQRMGQPVGMVDEFRGGPTLGAECSAGWMAGVGFEPGQTTIIDDCDGPTSSNAERTIGLYAPLGVGTDHQYPR